MTCPPRRNQLLLPLWVTSLLMRGYQPCLLLILRYPSRRLLRFGLLSKRVVGVHGG